MEKTDHTILIVDDHLTNRLKLSMAVNTLGYSTATANDGVQALEMLRSPVKYDLVLLDILMPGMDGHEVLASMKADESLRDIPVIVISAIEEMDSIVIAIERGAEDYLAKNFKQALLRARISACLEKKQLRDAVVQQRDFISEIFGKYVPESIARAVVEQKGALAPVRTVATILYTDIAGFTNAAESMTPDNVFGMLNEYFPAVIEPIHHYGGVINQFQGDAMLVTFNIPAADDSHADNALRAAQSIQSITRSQTFAGITLRTRIGINTGEVIAGNVGSGERINYTVHGDAVNLAARLEQLNKQYGTDVLVSDSTVNALHDRYELSPIGEVDIRGKNKSVAIHQLLHSATFSSATEAKSKNFVKMIDNVNAD